MRPFSVPIIRDRDTPKKVLGQLLTPGEEESEAPHLGDTAKA
jgi:hypothetical protein